MFTPSGTWVPDQPISPQNPNPNMDVAPQIRPNLQMNQQIPMQFNPQMNQFAGQMPMVNNAYVGPQQNIPAPPPPDQSNRRPDQGFSPFGPGGNQNQSPLNFGLLQKSIQQNIPNQMSQQPLQQVYSPQSQQAPLSMTQSVNHANPQDVQNYLHALHNSPQAGQNNAWRNPAGMQGQNAQAGFQGFQQNGVQNYGQQAVQYQQPHSGQQLGYSNTSANPGQNSFPQGGSIQIPQQQKPTATPAWPNYYGSHLPPVNAPRTAGEQNGTPQTPGAGGNGQNQNEGPPNKNNGGGNYPGQGDNAYSDVRVKQDIKQGDAQLQEFLDSLGVYDYEYKDPKYGEGRRISPMAQEIEKTPLGKAAISTNEEGYKMVDYGKLGGTMLASLAMLNHKYNELEESIKKGLISKGKIK